MFDQFGPSRVTSWSRAVSFISQLVWLSTYCARQASKCSSPSSCNSAGAR